MGDLAQAAGDLAGAGEHFRAGLSIAERLAAADPDNLQLRRDVAHSQRSLGVVAQAAGDLVEAEHRVRAALAAAEQAQDMQLSGAVSGALAEVLTNAGRSVEGLPYAVAAWRVLREDGSEVVAVLAEARRLLGEEQFTRLLSEQLEAEELAVVLAAAVPSAGPGEDSPSE